MTIKEEMLRNAGILNEGVAFFKTSKKLYKFALKIQKKVDKNPKLMPLLKEIEKLAGDFEKLEEQYKNSKKADKQKIKKNYDTLKKRYNKVLDTINRKSIKDLIGKFGLGGIMTLTLLFIGLALRNYASVAGETEEVLANVNKEIGDKKADLNQIKNDNVGSSFMNKLQRTPEMVRLESELEKLINTQEAAKDAISEPRKTLAQQVSGALGITFISGLLKKLYNNKAEQETFNKLRVTLRRLQK